MMTQFQNYVIQQVQSALQYLRGEGLNAPTPNQYEQNPPTREPIKHLLIGSPKAFTSTIHYLQVVGGCKHRRLESTVTNPKPR